MKKVKCDSGVTGWQGRLRKVYTNLDEFRLYDENYRLSKKLGFDTSEAAWKANPVIQGSVNASDFKIVRK